ncbi:MAG: T9SS type A sorting domain-containing protein [Muribaculaceae bacterium]|nr:T9SS type A sorting domain-containing protein [Muribaculaceae bacterium]
MKLLTLFGAVLVASLPWMAANAETQNEGATQLTLVHSDAKESHFLLSDKPEITFDDVYMHVSSSNAQVSVERAALSHFHFTKAAPAAIEGIAADDFTFSYVNNVVTVSGEGVTGVKIFDINGRCVKEAAAVSGVATVDLSTLTRGVYVVVIPGKEAVKVRVNN